MKMSQWSRFCWSGLAALVIMFAVVLQPQHAFSQLTSPLPTPTAPATDVIDLTVDKDHDGLPDQLQAAIQEYEAVLDAVSKKGGDPRNDPASLDALQKADDKLVRRLPYSAQTRAAGARLAAFYQKLGQASDQASRDKLWAEVQAIQAQMLQDSNFALVDQLLSRRLLDALKAKAPPPSKATATTAQSAASQVESTTMENAPIQAAAANGGGQTVVPISWSELFPTDPCVNTSAPNFNQLYRGKILFRTGTDKINNFFYAKKFSHIGIYNGVTNNEKRVYEANPEDGVNLRPLESLDNWKKHGICVESAHVLNVQLQDVINAMNWAQLPNVFGTDGHIPYNYNFLDKTRMDAVYCSQLVWQIFMHFNKDLDNSHPATDVYDTWLFNRLFFIGAGVPAAIAVDPMVAPDEIALHPDVHNDDEGLNP